MANNKKQNQSQLNLLPVNLPAANPNSAKLLTQLLKTVDDEMRPVDGTTPSVTIKDVVSKLNPYQSYLFHNKLTDTDVEKLKDIADPRTTKTQSDKLAKLLAHWSIDSICPAELVSRAFTVINHLNRFKNPNGKWLLDLKTILEKDEVLLIKLSLKLAFFTPAQAISYVKSLEYFVNNGKLKEILK